FRLVLFRSLILRSTLVFQAEDGIRDRNVTGVQACALPISSPRRIFCKSCWPTPRRGRSAAPKCCFWTRRTRSGSPAAHWTAPPRSEERRAGEATGSRTTRGDSKGTVKRRGGTELGRAE